VPCRVCTCPRVWTIINTTRTNTEITKAKRKKEKEKEKEREKDKEDHCPESHLLHAAPAPCRFSRPQFAQRKTGFSESGWRRAGLPALPPRPALPPAANSFPVQAKLRLLLLLASVPSQSSPSASSLPRQKALHPVLSRISTNGPPSCCASSSQTGRTGVSCPSTKTTCCASPPPYAVPVRHPDADC
jgi:hypothetical protein